MTNEIRRNKDGQQNLVDLRKALDASPHVMHRQGSEWIGSQWSEFHGAYLQTQMPYWYDERATIQRLLFGEIETEIETESYRRS